MIRISVKNSKLNGAAPDALRKGENANLAPDDCNKQMGASKNILKGARVLLVEDHFIDRMVTEALLKDEGVFVISVENERDAAEAVLRNFEENKLPHAILTVLHTPETDGFEATRIIRNDPRFQKIPIIAMAESNSREIREKCFGCGMNDFIAKPVEASELHRVLSECLVKESSSEKSTGMSFSAGSQMPSRVESAERFPKCLPGIDFEEGVRKLGRNPRLYEKLLGQFVEDYENLGERIVEAIRAGDFEIAGDLTHGIKGVAGNLSITGLFEASKVLDAAIKSRNTSSIPALAQEFCESLDQAIHSIGTYLIEKDGPLLNRK